MANGQRVHDGAVAVPRSEKLGGVYRILSGSMAGKVVTAEDHIGHGSEFDIWVANCAAEGYGRQTIQIERIA